MGTISCVTTDIWRDMRNYDTGALLVCFESVFTGYCAGATLSYVLCSLRWEAFELCAEIRIPQADSHEGYASVLLTVDTYQAWTVTLRYDAISVVDAQERERLGKLVGAFLKACVSLEWAR